MWRLGVGMTSTPSQESATPPQEPPLPDNSERRPAGSDESASFPPHLREIALKEALKNSIDAQLSATPLLPPVREKLKEWFYRVIQPSNCESELKRLELTHGVLVSICQRAERAGEDVASVGLQAIDTLAPAHADFNSQLHMVETLSAYQAAQGWEQLSLLEAIRSLWSSVTTRDSWSGAVTPCAEPARRILEATDGFRRRRLPLETLLAVTTHLRNLPTVVYETPRALVEGVHDHMTQNGYTRIMLQQLTAVENPLQKTVNLLKRGELKGFQDIVAHLRVVWTHAAFAEYLRSQDEGALNRAETILKEWYTHDNPPYGIRGYSRQDQPEALVKAHAEMMRIARLCHDDHLGFSSWTIEAKRPPDGSDSLLLRFAKESAQVVRLVHAEDGDVFPGRGVYFAGLVPERLFLADKKRADAPFHHYESAWPWVSGLFEDLRYSHFVFSRGLKAVIPPEHEKFTLHGTHYSYVAFNEHFFNEQCIPALAVPTSILKKALQAALLDPAGNGNGRQVKDASEVGLEPSALIAAAEKEGLEVLRLAWPSVLGGLGNAYRAGSKPYFEWERTAQSGYRDLAGHKHKSFILGSYESRMTPALSARLAPLREAHEKVFQLAANLHGLLDLCYVANANWHKGQTVTENEEGSEEELEPEEVEEQELHQEEEEPQEEEEQGARLNPKSLRMLEESYRWHALRNNGEQSDLNAFPLLVIGNPWRRSERGDGGWVLDTYSMRLYMGDTYVQFPEELWIDYDGAMKLWKEFAHDRFFRSSSTDPRLMRRGDVDWNIPQGAKPYEPPTAT